MTVPEPHDDADRPDEAEDTSTATGAPGSAPESVPLRASDEPTAGSDSTDRTAEADDRADDGADMPDEREARSDATDDVTAHDGADPASAGAQDDEPDEEHHDEPDVEDDEAPRTDELPAQAPDDPMVEAQAEEPDEEQGDAAGDRPGTAPVGGEHAPPGARHAVPETPAPGGLRALGSALRPRAKRSQAVVGVLCALLGFALVVQVSQTQEDQLSSLRQSDLVRLLDDVTQRSEELEDQVSDLEATRDELQSGSGRQRAALEVAEQQAQTQGILSGRLPAQGPGVRIDVAEGDRTLRGFAMFNVLEELRNAGAEAMQVNGVRLVTSSYFEDSDEGLVVDGQVITSPYRWTAIGDPSTLETALEIPGGAMASLRSDGARTTITQEDGVTVDAVREPADPQYATPAPVDSDD